ncbi:MAG: hypothetical protein EA362_00160 [Saprospirales bacterium]|nr:MAG: hypothetical protein EA362_00160 [Saprospirales bacterium]
MKCFYWFVLFFNFGIFHLYCQDSIFIQNNQILFKAEMQIVNGDYCGAMENFLELAKQPNLVTAYKINGLVSTLECDSMAIDNIEFFISLLFEIGAPIEYFEDELGRYSYFSSENWEKLKQLKPEFDRNNIYIRKVEEMIRIDQEARGYNNTDSMEWADFRVYMMMQELSREIGGGLMGPEQLGFDYRPLGYLSNGDHQLLIIHQIKSRPFDWGEYLPQMYFDGHFSPRGFSFYYTLAKACNKKELACFPYPPENLLQIDGQLYACSGQVRKTINENREFFFLDSVEDQIAKSLYRASTDKPFRSLGRSIPIYSLPADADADEKVEFLRMVKEMGFEKMKE